MDFELSDEQKMFRDIVRRFCETELAPMVEEAEDTETFPLEIFPMMGRRGYLCIRYPEEFGGAGADKVTEVIFREEMSRINQGFASSWSSHSHLATSPICAFGTDEQRQKYLIPAIKGDKIGAFALTEPNAGSDVKAIESTARREGDHYLLNGRKTFITNGTFADFVTLAAYTKNRRAGYDGISLLILDKGTPGFHVARKLKKEGLRSSETAELNFEDCRIPVKNLIGGREGMFKEILTLLAEGRIGVAGNMVGLARAAFDTALSYARVRVQFGQTIGKFQAVSHKLSDMALKVEAARMMTCRAAWLFDNKLPWIKDASFAKLLASETAVSVARDAVQILGGYGQMREYPVGRYLRDALTYTVGEGTSEIQRNIIAKELGL